jgi:integrative and conjugative element protein (TIGR02256 family)
LFDATVVRTLQRWRQIGTKPEAGGTLLGYRRDPHLHVVTITEPGQRDIRNRYGFLRRDGAHQAAALALWKRTQATGYYLGEWHTHSERVPTPSSLDQREWEKLMQGTIESDLLFLIVGLEGWYLQRGRSLIS